LVTNPLNGRRQKFNHHVSLETTAIDEKFIVWCYANCTDLWGYWFEDLEIKLPVMGGGASTNKSYRITSIVAHMSFKSLDDMVKFKLCCLNG
jgi:hypothetical protein